MSNFIGRPPFSNSLWVGIETMQFHIAQTQIFLRTPSFPIQGVPMNNLAPMKNCPGGVQGNLNWMPGYIYHLTVTESYLKSCFWREKSKYYTLSVKSANDSLHNTTKICNSLVTHLCRMEFPTFINWNSPFPFYRSLGCIFNFVQILKAHSVSKQCRT